MENNNNGHENESSTEFDVNAAARMDVDNDDSSVDGSDASSVDFVMQAAIFWMQSTNAIDSAAAHLLLNDAESHDDNDYEAPPQGGIHSSNPRGRRRSFDHAGCRENIYRDYLGPTPLFGAEFKLMFRLSRPRFEVMLQDVANSGIPFYQVNGWSQWLDEWLQRDIDRKKRAIFR
mmetsp:Transcript_398/g.1088  ORF Transcript_398/g.1088 Transcript_398/m.1088 type:complete len:175 (-) Transcript_398:14-538(-)